MVSTRLAFSLACERTRCTYALAAEMPMRPLLLSLDLPKSRSSLLVSVGVLAIPRTHMSYHHHYRQTSIIHHPSSISSQTYENRAGLQAPKKNHRLIPALPMHNSQAYEKTTKGRQSISRHTKAGSSRACRR